MLIRKGAVERRAYQESIARSCLKGNTLVCLPTGLGKSIIAAMVAADRLLDHSDGRAIILAPTRPLVTQHYRTFKRIMDLEPSDFSVITGGIPPSKRCVLWGKKLAFATPQVLLNDLFAGRLDLSGVVLMVFDEAHRAVGGYPYTFIAERYASEPNALILASTASPGSGVKAIVEICRNLYIENIEARSRRSIDVKTYVGKVRSDWITVRLPPIFNEVRQLFLSSLEKHLKPLQEYGYVAPVEPEGVKLRSLLEAREKIRREFEEGIAPKRFLQELRVNLYVAVQLLHIMEMLETQGLFAAKAYLDGLTQRVSKRPTPFLRELLTESPVRRAKAIIEESVRAGLDHPKVAELKQAVARSLLSGARRIIVFTGYRGTASRLVEVLNSVSGVSAARLVGQVSKGADRGLPQRRQTELLDEFRAGRYNVLVCTQIGEEGLDIEECDEAIFYDMVPSVIRYIQRRGRTGRRDPGKVTMMITLGTRDEAYYRLAKLRERAMMQALKSLTSQQLSDANNQRKLEQYLGLESRGEF